VIDVNYSCRSAKVIVADHECLDHPVDARGADAEVVRDLLERGRSAVVDGKAIDESQKLSLTFGERSLHDGVHP
jgi:hypothetical protein